MANVSSLGLGSNLDLAGLLEKLVAAQRRPTETRLARDEALTQARISAVGAFRAALLELQTAVKTLKSSDTYSKRSATSSNTALFTASADKTAASGTYGVEVVALATAHKLRSSAFASSSSVVGTGTLTIQVGSASFSVEVTSANNTLSQIRDTINSAADNKGVSASIVTADGGARLLLTSNSTGAANALRVTRSGGDGGLDALVYDPGVLTNLTEQTPAANAQVRVDGLLYTGSATNAVTGVIGGVTLNLVKADPATATLTVAKDNGAASAAADAFIKAYNKVVTTISDLTKYDAVNKRASALTGDSLLRNAGAQLRAIVSDAVSGGTAPYTNLFAVGVTAGADGTLTLDSAKLDAALKDKPAAVETLFTSTAGYATKLDTLLEGYLKSGGQVAAKTDNLDANLKDIGKQREALELRMAALESRLRAQFTALDSLVSRLRASSNFLSEQLRNLPGARSTEN